MLVLELNTKRTWENTLIYEDLEKMFYASEKLREAFIKKKKSVTFFTLGSDPPLFSGKCNENPKKK